VVAAGESGCPPLTARNKTTMPKTNAPKSNRLRITCRVFFALLIVHLLISAPGNSKLLSRKHVTDTDSTIPIGCFVKSFMSYVSDDYSPTLLPQGEEEEMGRGETGREWVSAYDYGTVIVSHVSTPKSMPLCPS
jgi:hypothetical protein